MKENKDLLYPICRILDLKKIRYWHLQKNSSNKKDWNKKFTGLPDLLIFLQSGYLWAVELKTAEGKLSEKQIEWAEYFFKYSFFYSLIKSIEDFNFFLNKYNCK